MEKQSVTIYTVAREARVSMATVSRVVNGNPNVKPETRKKVLDVIKQLNYRPNAVARGLASKKTTTVGVVIPDVTNAYFAELALGIDDIASMYKYNMILTNSDADDRKALQVVRGLMAKQVDGIIFMGHDISEELRQEFSSSNVPVVVAGSVTNDDELPTVRIDYQEAAKQAIKYLIERVDGPVALVVGSKDSTINKRYRIEGYKQALQEAGKDFDEKLIFETHDSYAEGYKQSQAIADSGAKAAFVSDDGVAAGLLNGLTDHGVKVPDEFQIVASNNTKTTEITRPKLTTITQPLYDLGAVSMRLLTKLMNSKDEDKEDDESKDVILEHGFKKRQSTR